MDRYEMYIYVIFGNETFGWTDTNSQLFVHFMPSVRRTCNNVSELCLLAKDQPITAFRVADVIKHYCVMKQSVCVCVCVCVCVWRCTSAWSECTFAGCSLLTRATPHHPHTVHSASQTPQEYNSTASCLHKTASFEK
jgi:hypothetical protein